MKGFLPIITLVLGLVGGILISGADPKISDDHAHEEEGHMAHEIRNVTGVAPSLDLIMHEVSEGEFVAQIKYSNFKVTPLGVSGEDVAGEGHAHIYLNGEKLNRVLGEWYNIGKLESGDYEVSVRLSSNDHHELAVGGELITDMEELIVGHTHDEDGEHHEEDEHMRGDSVEEMNVE